MFTSVFKKISLISKCNFSDISHFKICGSLLTSGPIVGSEAQVSHVFSQQSVKLFSDVSGDNNPLHLDRDFASKTIFGKPVVHGILVSSLFSTIFGRSIKGSIYVSQSLKFRKPVYVDSIVNAQIIVLKSDQRKSGTLLTCSTHCKDEFDNILIEGEAQVLLPKE